MSEPSPTRQQHQPPTPSSENDANENSPLLSYDTFQSAKPLYTLAVRVDPHSVEEKWIEEDSPTTLHVSDVQKLHWDHANNVSEGTYSGSNRRKSTFSDDEAIDDEGLNILLDPYYDVTTGRMKRLFAYFTHDNTDAVTYEAFQHGLLALGIGYSEGVDFDAFVKKIDTNNDGKISFHEFVKVVQMIKLAHLFKPEYNLQAKTLKSVFRVVDYSAMNIHTVNPVQKIESFIFSSKPKWATVRWVHMAGISDLSDLHMRRLAIKYQLHPLAVEDCLKKSDSIRCKFEQYEDHAFLVLPVARPVEQKAHIIQDYIRSHRAALFEKDQALGDGVELDNDDYLSKKPGDLHDMLQNLHCLMRKPQQLCIFMARNSNILSVQENPDFDEDEKESSFKLWSSIYDENMCKSYSKLRNHDHTFLVVAIINAIVDDMRPLIQVFEVKIAILEALQAIEGTKFDTKLISHAKKQLIALDKVTRPFLDLIEGPLYDVNEFRTGEVKNYIRDVKDHLKQMASDIKDYQQALQAIITDDQYTRAKSQADVAQVISVVAALFLPGTFMTGLYGMNFDNMPELHTQNGYYVWWVVFITICTIMITYIKFYRQWI
ncbi:CorA Metal Ion Transporter (MIT) Family [Thraustotheca clavata]|uniref:CorA Metal Ion Transporter (MIT) Family n=1 Tax=Thraustotheca clavata TaxID=74557 RepID=A0A1V9ZQ92_9STRA|nr:CorA Metal Ion Transporter (MIT) Family [Thraustotheca clavata]